jgi:hypothetical protein
LGGKNISLKLNNRFVSTLRHIAIFTLPASDAEAVTICTDTICKALCRAFHFDLAATTHVSRLAKALAESTETALAAAKWTRILKFDAAVVSRATINAVALTKVTNTTVGAVVGALEIASWVFLASVSRVAGVAGTSSLDANTMTAARERGTFTCDVFGAVGTFKARQALALTQQTRALTLDTALWTDFFLFAECASRAREAEAFAE